MGYIWGGIRVVKTGKSSGREESGGREKIKRWHERSREVSGSVLCSWREREGEREGDGENIVASEQVIKSCMLVCH